MFELALPWVLLAFILPVFVWFFVPRASYHLSSALKIPFFNALHEVIESDTAHWGHSKKAGFLYIIWLLILIALSGPRWVGQPVPVAREGYNIMLALDLSGSMELTDMLLNGRPVSRLSVVKRSAEQFVKERSSDKIGLILFGSRAYLQTPLTYDYQNVLMRIEDASVGLAGNTTSIGDALGLAVKRLQTTPKQGRVVILLTDGANNSGVLPPHQAAELARSDDITVYTIGLGADEDSRGLNSLFLNRNRSADLDEKTLGEIAKITGGRYFRATDSESLHHIYDTINQLVRVSFDEQTIRPLRDYYTWPLGAALLLMFGWLMHEARLWQRFFRVSYKERVI